MKNGERQDSFLLLPVSKNGKEGDALPVKRLMAWAMTGCLVLSLTSPVFSGISTPFAEVSVRNLQIGQTYIGSREVTLNQPYIAENQTDSPLDFTVEASIPSEQQLVKG